MFFNNEIRIYLKTDWFLISFNFFLLQIFSALINEINFNSIIRSLGFFKFFIYALSLVVVFNYKEKYFNYYLKITFFIFCFIILDSLIQYKFTNQKSVFFGRSLYFYVKNRYFGELQPREYHHE